MIQLAACNGAAPALRTACTHAADRRPLTWGARVPQEKPHFWKRKPSIVKVHMLLLAHLARAEVPRSLQADLRFVLAKAPLLLEEMVKIANLPRPPAGYGWLSPSVGALEMMQCITRAQPLHVRKTLAYGGKARAPAGSVKSLRTSLYFSATASPRLLRAAHHQRDSLIGGAVSQLMVNLGITAW